MTHGKMSVVAALGLATTLGLGRQAVADDPGRADSKFQEMDTNNDGKISQDEHASFARRNFQRMDADGDGRITAAEARSEKGRMADKGGKGEYAEEKIKSMDTNGDGAVSSAEYSSASQARFDAMDTNKDGALSKSELKSHARMKRGPAPSRDMPAPSNQSTGATPSDESRSHESTNPSSSRNDQD